MKKISYIFFVILYSLIFNGCGEQVPLKDLVGDGDKKPTTNLKYELYGKDNDKRPITNKNEQKNDNNSDDDKNKDNDKNDDDDKKEDKDDDKKEGNGENRQNKIHHQGQPCLICHKFASAGTIYNKSNKPAINYNIRLITKNGSLSQYLKGRGEGNFYLHNFNAKTFTAKVIDTNGNIVNSSKINSHDNTRLDCNRCHTRMGLNNAPQRIWSFRK